MVTVQKKKPEVMSSTARQRSHLAKLERDGGKPVRVDTSGEDLALLAELVEAGYGKNNADAYRVAMRDAHKKLMKKKIT